MTQLNTVDPYLPHYIYEKQTNPKTKLVWKAFDRNKVAMVDKIVEMSRGHRDYVKTLKDWEIVGELLNFFAESWPNEFNEFRKTIPDIRSTRRADGYSASREIKYVGALPGRLIRLIKAIFTEQQFDKPFVNKFVKKFPLFMVGGKSNLGKGGVIL